MSFTTTSQIESAYVHFSNVDIYAGATRNILKLAKLNAQRNYQGTTVRMLRALVKVNFKTVTLRLRHHSFVRSDPACSETSSIYLTLNAVQHGV
jgi:hypothetical protein